MNPLWLALVIPAGVILGVAAAWVYARGGQGGWW